MSTTAVPAPGGTRATLAALALALVAFVLTVAGLRTLQPTNVAWLLSSDDQAEAYLGWEFYRDLAPNRIPAISDQYGLELGSGLFYSDTIPLLSVPLKQVSAWLPQPFQYTGWWIFGCFVLQAIFASKLLGLLSLTAVQRNCALVLFLFAPPLLYRIGWHTDLAAHWLLLAGLYLYFGPSQRLIWLKWISLLVAASLIHSYLFGMTGALWAADLLRRAWMERQSLVALAAEGVAAVGLCLGALWCAGFFTIGAGHIETGFGYYKMNVLSPIDAGGWSYVLPDIPEGGGDYEGFNYLGLGLLLLAVLAVAVLFKDRAWRQLPRSAWPMVIVLGLLSAYAISNVITIGPHDVEIPLPGFLDPLLNLLRSSGRMFWPVFYAIAFAVLALLAMRYSGKRALTWLLAVAAVVQVVDTSAGWWPRREKFETYGAKIESPLHHAFWQEAGSRYSKLRVVPLQRWTPEWRTLVYYAEQHGMGTDAARLSRVDQATFDRAVAQAENTLRDGGYADDSLYVIEAQAVPLARASMRPGDLLREFDGFTVLAPRFCAATPNHSLCAAPVASRDPIN